MRRLTALLFSLTLFACGEPSAPSTRTPDPPDAVSTLDADADAGQVPDVLPGEDVPPAPDAGPDASPDLQVDVLTQDTGPDLVTDLGSADAEPDVASTPDLQPDVLADVPPDHTPRGDGGRKMPDASPPDAPSCPSEVYCIDDLLITTNARVQGGPVDLGTNGSSSVPYGTYHLTVLTVDYLDNSTFTGGQASGALRIDPNSILFDDAGNRCGSFTAHLLTRADGVTRNHRGAGLWNSSSGAFTDLCTDSVFAVHSYYASSVTLTITATGTFGSRDARLLLVFRLDGT